MTHCRIGYGFAIALILTLGHAGTALAQSENQLSLFNALNADCGGAGNFGALCAATVAGGNAEFQEATAEEIGANTRAATEASNGALSSIAGRLAAIRGGATGFVVDGHRPGLDAYEASTLGWIEGRGAGDSPGVADTGKLSGFANLKYGFGDKDADSFENELDFDSYGGTVGLDYRLSEQLVLGGAFGYSFHDIDFENDAQASASGELEIDGYSFSGYGTYYQDDFYVDAIVNVGFSDHELDRDIFTAPATPLTASSDTDGMSYGGSLAAGMNFSQGSATITPFVRLNYQDVEIDGFTEGGSAAQFILTVEDQEFESLLSELGVQASNAISTNWGVILPFVRAAYKHEFKDDGESTTAFFPNQASFNPFTIKGKDRDEDYFGVGAGASAVFQGGVQGFVSYDTVLGLSDLTSHVITAGVRVEF